MRFKVGDEVRIKAECKANKEYGNDIFLREMEEYKDMKLTILYIANDEYYIKEDGQTYGYTDEMLEPFEFKVGDMVKVVRLENEAPRNHNKLGNVYTIEKLSEECKDKEKSAILKEVFSLEFAPYLKNLELIKNCGVGIRLRYADEEDNNAILVKRAVKDNIENIKLELTSGEEISFNINDISNSPISTLKEFEDAINQLSDNNESEENNMEILDIYEDRKIEEINEKYDKQIERIKELDKVQQIIRDAENRLNVLLDKDEDNSVSLYYYELEKTTKEKIKEREEERAEKLFELDELLCEVKAQLDMAETYETKIDILKNYGILDKDGKINNGEDNEKSRTTKSKK